MPHIFRFPENNEKNSYLHFWKLSEHGTGKPNDTNLQIGWEKLQLFLFSTTLTTTKFVSATNFNFDLSSLLRKLIFNLLLSIKVVMINLQI